MLTVQCRMAAGLRGYAQVEGKKEAKCQVTWEQRKIAAEMEAVGQQVSRICYLAQSDSKYTGPYRPVFAHALRQINPESSARREAAGSRH